MKRFFKWYIVVLLVIAGTATFESCGPAQYRTYKKYVKRKSSAMGYRSNYQKKLRRNTMPINRNYIIRNRHTQPTWK